MIKVVIYRSPHEVNDKTNNSHLVKNGIGIAVTKLSLNAGLTALYLQGCVFGEAFFNLNLCFSSRWWTA